MPVLPLSGVSGAGIPAVLGAVAAAIAAARVDNGETPAYAATMSEAR
jgi:hypothetical protein